MGPAMPHGEDVLGLGIYDLRLRATTKEQAQRSLNLLENPQVESRVREAFVLASALHGRPGPIHLSAVTLEDHLQRVSLRVLASNGHPVSKGVIRVVGTSGAGASRPIRDGLGELWLDRPRAVEVQVEGYSPLTIPNVFADIVVSVEKE